MSTPIPETAWTPTAESRPCLVCHNRGEIRSTFVVGLWLPCPSPRCRYGKARRHQADSGAIARARGGEPRVDVPVMGEGNVHEPRRRHDDRRPDALAVAIVCGLVLAAVVGIVGWALWAARVL